MKKMNLAIFVALATIGLCCISVKAMAPEDSTNSDYLKNHGHSPEMIRLINLQKQRIEQKPVTEEVSRKKAVWDSKPMKTVRMWFRTSDVTMSPDFGDNKIKF